METRMFCAFVKVLMSEHKNMCVSMYMYIHLVLGVSMCTLS